MSSDCHCPTAIPDFHLKDINLSGAAVHRFPLAAFFFMPLSYHNYAERQRQAVIELDLQERWPGLILSHTGMFRGSIMRVLENADSPSRFVSVLNADFKLHGYLHKGGIGTLKTAIRALQNRLFDQGRMPKEMYLSYVTCPLCEAKKGGEQILLLRRYSESQTLKNRLKKQQ